MRRFKHRPDGDDVVAFRTPLQIVLHVPGSSRPWIAFESLDEALAYGTAAARGQAVDFWLAERGTVCLVARR